MEKRGVFMSIKYLNDDETMELLDVLREDKGRHATRNRAIFFIAKYCALRVSEIGALRLEHYNSRRGEIHCVRSKGSLSNTIRILDDEVSTYLNYYMYERLNMDIDSPYFFLSQLGNPISRKTLDTHFKRYCQNTSIPRDKQHFHVLKHTRAVELANSGIDVKDVQWWLGHKNIDNTLIYLQYTTAQQETLYKKLEQNMYTEKNMKYEISRNYYIEEPTYGYLFNS